MLENLQRKLLDKMSHPKIETKEENFEFIF